MDHVGGVSERQQLDIVSELEAMNVEIDHDVVKIGVRVWAIHGRIAYDGEVIAATFASEREAWFALSCSTSAMSPASPPPPPPAVEGAGASVSAARDGPALTSASLRL